MAEDNVFAQLGLLGRSQKAVPQALTRRVLELLAYLAKHQTRMAREMLTLRVPSPNEQAQLIERPPVCHVTVRQLLRGTQLGKCCPMQGSTGLCVRDSNVCYVCGMSVTPQELTCPGWASSRLFSCVVIIPAPSNEVLAHTALNGM